MTALGRPPPLPGALGPSSVKGRQAAVLGADCTAVGCEPVIVGPVPCREDQPARPPPGARAPPPHPTPAPPPSLRLRGGGGQRLRGGGTGTRSVITTLTLMEMRGCHGKAPGPSLSLGQGSWDPVGGRHSSEAGGPQSTTLKACPRKPKKRGSATYPLPTLPCGPAVDCQTARDLGLSPGTLDRWPLSLCLFCARSGLSLSDLRAWAEPVPTQSHRAKVTAVCPVHTSPPCLGLSRPRLSPCWARWLQERDVRHEPHILMASFNPTAPDTYFYCKL